MSNRNRSDMAEFKLWLQQTKHVSKSSSTVYASRVRKVLSRLDSLTSQSLDMAMESLKKDSYHSHMSCWNQFREFCAEKGIILPECSNAGVGASPKDGELPELVCLALLKIVDSCGLKPQVMVGLRWKHVEMRGNADWWISDPLDPTTIYMAPSNPMRILCDWANGETEIEKERPLVPRIALSMVPMTQSGIRSSISGRRRNRLD